MSFFTIPVARLISRILDALQLRLCRKHGYESLWLETSVGRMHALRFRGAGTLPPVLLVHGLSSSAPDFEPLLAKLRGPYSEVLAVDLPGHGQSYRGEHPPSGAEMRQALAEAVDQLLDQPALVYGNSLGGYAAICLALDRPQWVGKLMLGSPGGAPMTPSQLNDVLTCFRMRTHGDAMNFMSRIMETTNWMRPLVAQACLGRLSQPHMVPLLKAIGGARLLSPEDVAQIAVPTVVIWGKGERLLPQTVHDFFQEHLPEGTAFEYPEGAGHVPHSDRPGWMSRRILAMAQS